MKVGIDARFYGEAGPGRYIKAVIQHLEKIDNNNTYLVFLRKKGYDLYQPQNPNFCKVLADYTWYSFEEQTKFLLELIKNKLNLFYVPHFNIPVLYPGKIVTAIPDLIMHSYSSQRGTTLPKFYFKIKKAVYRFVFWWAVFRSSKVIVPSEDVLNDFQKTYPEFSRQKYVLAYEGVDPDFLKLDIKINTNEVLEKYGIKTPFLLYVGSAYEHKNLYRLIQAFKNLKEEHGYEGQLVIAGKKDTFSEKLKEYSEKEGLNKNIVFPGLQGYICDQEIIALRTQAQLYVFPSLKEGFSLTPMEAQAVGLACVISNIPIHREIYQDSVEYFNPSNIEDIAQAILKVLRNMELKESLIEKGYQVTRKYNWNDTAQITKSVMEESVALH